jgi:hypothetical protein
VSPNLRQRSKDMHGCVGSSLALRLPPYRGVRFRGERRAAVVHGGGVVSGGGGQVRVWGLLRGTATRHRGGQGGCAEAAGGAGGDAAKPWVRGGAGGVGCQ